jgi:O-methyltransferase involved in polyketide biosynthesis
MTTEKVRFTQEKETLLITLYGKALNSRTSDPILSDPWAEEAVSRIDYDFGKLKVRTYEALSIALRSKQFDVWTLQYLNDHPDAAVLHLGCGLDSRVYRIDPPAGVLWFDVDFPDVIELRRRLYPQRDGYQMVGSPLADLGWLDAVPEDRQVFVVAEGVTQYLSEEIMRGLLNRVTGHFPGGQFMFDAYSQRLVRRLAKSSTGIKGTGASFSWGIDDPQDI